MQARLTCGQHCLRNGNAVYEPLRLLGKVGVSNVPSCISDRDGVKAQL